MTNLQNYSNKQIHSLNIAMIEADSQPPRLSRDPNKEELVRFCENYRDSLDTMSDDEWEFSLESALYYFASMNHGGQWSNLYKVLCNSHYSPGRMENFEKWSENDFAGFYLYEVMNSSYVD